MLRQAGRRGADANKARKAGASSVVIAAVLIVALVVPAAPAEAIDIRYEETPVAGWSVNGTVLAVHLHGDVVYVGGAFSQAIAQGGVVTRERHNLAAFDRITGEVLPFRADTNGVVRGIAAAGDTVWVGGHFTDIAGVARDRLAAIDGTTGTLRSAFEGGANATVWDVEYSGSRVFIGGEFTAVNGETAQRIAALDPASGANDPLFSARASGTVRSLAFSAANDILYAGGSFTSIGGTSRDQLAGLDPATGDAKGVAFAEPGSLVHDVDVADDGATVFAAIGGTRNRAQAWSTSSGGRRWERIAMGDVQAVGYEDGRLYFGFHEGYGNDTTVRLLVADAASGRLDDSFRPRVNSFYGVWAIDAAPGALIVGGEFTRVEGVNSRGVAIFPRDGIPDLLPPSRPGGVYAHGASATSIEVAWEPSTDDVGISRYVVRRDAEIVGQVTSAVFLDEGLEPDAEYRYTIEAVDTVERSSGESDPVTLETWSHIVEAGATWRYNDSGRAQPGWTTIGFDDSGWSVGAAQLGFGEGDEATEIPRGELTYYFRRTFATPGGREVLKAALALVRDDGAVAYLNGVEVFRSNLPDGAIDEDTAASTTTGGADESRWFESEVSANLFRPGNNVVAVEVHQTNISSSDVSFDLRLDGELSDEPFDQTAPTRPKSFAAIAKSATKIRLEWQAATDNRGIEGYRVFRNGTEIAFTAALNYVDTGLVPDHEYKYKVRAVDTSLNVGPRSAIGIATTLSDTEPPSPVGNPEVTNVSGTTAQLRWNPATDDVGIDHYIVRVNGRKVADSTETDFLVTGLEPMRRYHFMVRPVDSAGNKGDKAHVYESTTPLIVTAALVVAGDSWRYHARGSNLGTEWRSLDYDVSGWGEGNSELGYGDGDENTTVSGGPVNDRYVTTYFRTEFTIGLPDEVPELMLRLIRDDGAVVYINGVEVFRTNMPNGSVTHQTTASRGVSGSEETSWIEVLISPSNLTSGRNVIAVEIHQADSRSSDISFNAELIANP